MSNHIDRITVNPEICGGRPCIRGLRLRVKDVLDMLAGGSTRGGILRDDPYLEGADRKAAPGFATPATAWPANLSYAARTNASKPESAGAPSAARVPGLISCQPTRSNQRSSSAHAPSGNTTAVGRPRASGGSAALFRPSTSSTFI